MSMEVQLSQQQAEEILSTIGIHGPVKVEEIVKYNHVYRLTGDNDAFYLKTYTKDWYGDDVAATEACVEHEVAAWQVLAKAGISVPEVAIAEYSTTNPLGRPFLMTQELQGTSLTTLLATADTSTFKALLNTTGRYLRRCHDITFANPGYIMRDGPVFPDDPQAWKHFLWTAEQRQKDALGALEQNKNVLPTEMVHQLAER